MWRERVGVDTKNVGERVCTERNKNDMQNGKTKSQLTIEVSLFSLESGTIIIKTGLWDRYIESGTIPGKPGRLECLCFQIQIQIQARCLYSWGPGALEANAFCLHQMCQNCSPSSFQNLLSPHAFQHIATDFILPIHHYATSIPGLPFLFFILTSDTTENQPRPQGLFAF